MKYEADGGPGVKKRAMVMRRYSGLPVEDLARFVRWAGFDYLIGNEDAHAKHLALLYLWDIRNVQRRDWQRFSAAVDVPWELVRATLLRKPARHTPTPF